MDSLKLENQLCFPLYAASREVVKQYAPYLSNIGLTYTQYIVMLVLWERELIGAKQLCELLYLDSGTITPVVKKLEQMGHVTRRRSKEDERAIYISLTDAGTALKKRAAEIPAKMAQCLALSDEEARTLYKLLYKVLQKRSDTI